MKCIIKSNQERGHKIGWQVDNTEGERENMFIWGKQIWEGVNHSPF